MDGGFCHYCRKAHCVCDDVLKCKQCGRKVPNDWQKKWKHVVKFHPEIMCNYLLPMIADPLEAQRLGEALGDWIKTRVMLP